MRRALAIAAATCALFGSTERALAQSSPTPSPSPSPRARAGAITLTAAAHTVLIDQATGGSGQVGPEASGFIAGSPISPNTPYDVLSSAPQTPGVAGIAQFVLTPTYAARAFDVSASLGAGYVQGSTTNAAFWGEPLMPTLNPHVGSQALPLRIVFPIHAGQDDATALRASLLGGSVATRDGRATLRAGWFDLAQTDRFVFIQPPITNVPPAIGMATAESLGNGTPSLDWWTAPAPSLPLQGLDFVGKQGLATVELSDASLPSLPGVGQRLVMGSLVVDHGKGLRYSAQALRVATGGDLIPTTVYSGIDGRLFASNQGTLPTSTIGGQRQTDVGLRAAFHATRALDAVTEYGRSSYDASAVAEPGSARPGNFYHLGLSRSIGRVTASVDAYRNEPRYATILLPYGTPENVWSIAWAWPGQWLKSNYQITDDAVANVNRQGYRVRYAIDRGPLEIHAIYANFGQIEPITLSRAREAGFVDGFFLPQPDAAPTLGRQHQYGLWVAWHPSLVDVTLDYAEDTMHRDNASAFPADAVSYDAPEAVLTTAHTFNKSTVVAAGIAYYGMHGTFGTGGFTNIDFHQTTEFFGAQFLDSPRTATLVTLRHASFGGIPSIPNGPSPAFSGTLLLVEQRVRI